ncbi:phage tail tape measure protein [Fusobacterium mortiferum]|jgi:uncharacterized coiled-coil DUF342 family protein|uniref:Phage tail tape measure protein, TP901 family n=1 Tax=Fusobacterium mortiferum ATCC 9817 TaxID=469616 RepID=A0ABN5JA03_FUSMR|nr:hypothetical protein [Fusobacterium mortiferum]AVQ18754.1 hypothetical protein C4N19_06475 [Fusobacterium mortiferum ATCC 9817]EEO34991.1 hypothetical protein FMAG_00553 [Fusobacterium mortiferum ATCC 9817]DAJ46198.1 MAG TPA: chromosome segregation ATPase [Caudoviricetes sp.]
MSKTIGVILSLKNALSEQIKPAIASLKEAEKQSEQAKEQLEVYKQAVEQAKANIAQYVTELENLKKSVVEQNREYQRAKANIDSLKNSNIELQNEITKQAMELDRLGQEYGSNSKEYKNAAKQLQALRQQHRNNNISIKEQTENLNRLEETIIKNSDAVNDMKSQEKALKEALEQAENSVSEQRKEILKLGNSFRQIEKEVEESKKTFKEWGKTVGSSIDGAVKSALKWGASIIGLTGGLGAGGAIKMGMETSINLEAYRTMLETATKDFKKTNKLMENAELLSISTPFSPEEVIQATATLESYGIDSEKWLAMIADAAGATNTTMEQATEAVKDILSKNEFQSMENLGVSKEMIIEAAEKKYGKNKVFNKQGQVKDQEKLQIVLEEIMVSKFDGGAEKLSQTVRGLWSTITGSVNMGLAKILGMENGLIKTGSILDIIKQKMTLLRDILIKWEEDGTLDDLAKEFTIVFTEIANSVISTYNFIKENHEVIIALTKFLGIIYILTKGVFALKAAFEAYQIAVTALSNIGFLVTIFTKLKLAIASFNLMLASTPVGWVTAAIGAIAFALYMLIFEFDKVKSFVGSLWDSLKSFADNMPWWASIIVGAFMPVITIIKGLGKVWEWAKSLFSDEDIEKNIEVTEKTKKDIQELAKPQVENKIPSQNKVFEESFAKVEAPQSLNSVKSNAITRATINNPRPAVTNSNNIYIQGDIYGYDEFKEKVAGVIVDISKNNMANVT